ncbi:hypothetical protein AGMMS50222_01490 [Endomicrobiia bacterium]|nr:hypothetical protein AGMMS49556_01350 [Endomicrobiia bacterium]GHT73655.1 hypothetical protein AGMMS50222_01490 [Endomicrobiia bacterium]
MLLTVNSKTPSVASTPLSISSVDEAEDEDEEDDEEEEEDDDEEDDEYNPVPAPFFSSSFRSF